MLEVSYQHVVTVVYLELYIAGNSHCIGMSTHQRNDVGGSTSKMTSKQKRFPTISAGRKGSVPILISRSSVFRPTMERRLSKSSTDLPQENLASNLLSAELDRKMEFSYCSIGPGYREHHSPAVGCNVCIVRLLTRLLRQGRKEDWKSKNSSDQQKYHENFP